MPTLNQLIRHGSVFLAPILLARFLESFILSWIVSIILFVMSFRILVLEFIT